MKQRWPGNWEHLLPCGSTKKSTDHKADFQMLTYCDQRRHKTSRGIYKAVPDLCQIFPTGSHKQMGLVFNTCCYEDKRLFLKKYFNFHRLGLCQVKCQALFFILSAFQTTTATAADSGLPKQCQQMTESQCITNNIIFIVHVLPWRKLMFNLTGTVLLG